MPAPLQASRKVYRIVPVYVVSIRWLLQQGPGSLKGTSATVSLKHSERIRHTIGRPEVGEVDSIPKYTGTTACDKYMPYIKYSALGGVHIPTTKNLSINTLGLSWTWTPSTALPVYTTTISVKIVAEAIAYPIAPFFQSDEEDHWPVQTYTLTSKFNLMSSSTTKTTLFNLASISKTRHHKFGVTKHGHMVPRDGKSLQNTAAPTMICLERFRRHRQVLKNIS